MGNTSRLFGDGDFDACDNSNGITVMKQQIFLSYSRTNTTAAKSLREQLQQRGFNVYRDEDSIRVGENWMQSLQEALQTCSAFVLLVGEKGVERWVGAEVEVAITRSLAPHSENQRLAIYPILLAEADPATLPPFLNRIQAQTWDSKTDLPDSLIEALKQNKQLLSEEISIEDNPYLGLSYFKRRHADRFFGRSEEALQALQGLGVAKELSPNPANLSSQQYPYNTWLQIHASSGAGKSSLLYAGLLPLIEKGMLWKRTGYSRWTILEPMMPGKKPVKMLAEKMSKIWPKYDLDEWYEKLNNPKKAEALSDALRTNTEAEHAVLLIVDQFEELFTFAEQSESRQFDRLVASALTDPECPFFLITTIRSDFIDRFSQLPMLQANELYNSIKSDYRLPDITEQGLRELISYPARLSGLQNNEALLEAIVHDAKGEPGALPLVESALSQLWEEAQSRGSKRLSKSYYDAHKGIVGMLAEQADTLLDSLGTKGKKNALALLLELTSINEGGRHTRRRLPKKNAVHVAGGGVKGDAIIQKLSGKRDDATPFHGPLRLIVTSQYNSQEQRHNDENVDNSYVELVHETLVRARDEKDEEGKPIGYWPTLYQYIFKNRDRSYQRKQLEIDAERWKSRTGLGKWFGLAGWRDLKIFRNLNPLADTDEGKYLKRSRLMAKVQIGLLVTVLVFLGQSFSWTRQHSLPLDSMLVQQKYRLINWGLVDEPLPKMLEIPSGTVKMGEHTDDFVKKIDKKYFERFGYPGTTVSIENNFFLSQNEITYQQYDYYVWEQHRLGNNQIKYPQTAKGGRDKRPVVYVSWLEANRYLTWLSEKTGMDYRLPTEAEWEHAARAGTESAYWWGDKIGDKNAVCDGCGTQWDKDRPVPVSYFKANPFGLHDTAGNVWEWTCSLWTEQFDGAHENKCETADDSSGSRVVRGGSWFSETIFLRSSARNRGNAVGRSDGVGFRAARTN